MFVQPHRFCNFNVTAEYENEEGAVMAKEEVVDPLFDQPEGAVHW
ncbi:MAG: hypothetical protein ABJA70_24270 [Chryseolinea sp.]